MKAVILLTGCINPNGMPFTQLTDTSDRQKQYVDAIHYYINNTDCKIVFCENSNTDINTLFKNKQDRLEILTFAGNQDKQRGKGYGETEIIEYVPYIQCKNGEIVPYKKAEKQEKSSFLTFFGLNLR